MIRQSFRDGLYLRQAGDPRATRTLLYIHGLGESGLGFEGLLRAPELHRWHHLVPDLPGYGKSPWPAAPVSLGELAETLAAWVRGTGLGPVTVVGHSMGGVIALEMAERHPELVAAVLNVEGNVSPDDCHFSSRIAARSVEELTDGALEKVLDAIYRAGVEDLPLRRYYASMRQCDPRQLHLNSEELVAESGNGQLAPRLGALAIPQLYLLGDPRGTGARSRGQLEQAGVEWRAVSDSGHWPFQDNPEEFLREMIEFLESTGG